jgi:hypothetical protein
MAIVLCEREVLATHRLTYLGSFFLDPEDVRELNLGAIWNFIKGTGLSWHGLHLRGTKSLSKAYVHRDRKGLTLYLLITQADVLLLLSNNLAFVNLALFF